MISRGDDAELAAQAREDPELGGPRSGFSKRDWLSIRSEQGIELDGVSSFGANSSEASGLTATRQIFPHLLCVDWTQRIVANGSGLFATPDDKRD